MRPRCRSDVKRGASSTRKINSKRARRSWGSVTNEDPNPNWDPKRHIVGGAAPNLDPNLGPNPHSNGVDPNHCGNKGATLQHPGLAGNHIGFQPSPNSVGQ